MSGDEKSLAEGISSLAAAGAMFAGEVAGYEVILPEKHQEKKEEFVWNDDEERRYREWMKEEAAKLEQEAEFSEFSQEEDYRRRLRQEAEARAGDQVAWEDARERLFREEYQRRRRGEQAELVWDTSGEREAQERARRRTEERRGQPITWDDADEKACMEMYRKKYS